MLIPADRWHMLSQLDGWEVLRRGLEGDVITEAEIFGKTPTVDVVLSLVLMSGHHGWEDGLVVPLSQVWSCTNSFSQPFNSYWLSICCFPGSGPAEKVPLHSTSPHWNSQTNLDEQNSMTWGCISWMEVGPNEKLVSDWKKPWTPLKIESDLLDGEDPPKTSVKRLNSPESGRRKTNVMCTG